MTQHPNLPHILSAFDQEMNHIRGLVGEMGTIAGRQILGAIEAMIRRDFEGAASIVQFDEVLDQLQEDTEREAIQSIGRWAPVADDLRELISAIKIAVDLERVGDYAKNIAKRIPMIAETAPVEPAIVIPEIAKLVVGMIDNAMTAYFERNTDLAEQVIQRDLLVDDSYNELFRSLVVNMVKNPEHTTQSVHLLFVAKNLERIGDHATNIAELVCYSATGHRATSRAGVEGAIHEDSERPGNQDS